jgi:hypothetical protein
VAGDKAGNCGAITVDVEGSRVTADDVIMRGPTPGSARTGTWGGAGVFALAATYGGGTVNSAKPFLPQQIRILCTVTAVLRGLLDAPSRKVNPLLLGNFLTAAAVVNCLETIADRQLT